MEKIEMIEMPFLIRPIESMQWMNQPCSLTDLALILGATMIIFGMVIGIIVWLGE